MRNALNTLLKWKVHERLELNLLENFERMPSERRQYTLLRLAQHLYDAQEWPHLFMMLDMHQYGWAKLHYDPSTFSYARDLDFGRRAATWSGWRLEESLGLFPHLWRYTFLRCSLKSRANQYPSKLFHLLLLLGREQEVLGLAELLTDPSHQALVFQSIAEYLSMQPVRKAESLQISLRAHEIAGSISDSKQQAWALRRLAEALVQTQRWEQAEKVARSISDSNMQSEVLEDLAGALARAQRWEQAEEVACSISSNPKRARVSMKIVGALAQAQRWEQAERVACSISSSSARACAFSALAGALTQAQRWEQAESFWTLAAEVARPISDSDERAWTFSALAGALTQAQRWEQAESFWTLAAEAARSISNSDERARVSMKLVEAMAQAQRWEQAEEVARSIPNSYQRVWVLTMLAEALAQAQRWEKAEEVARSISSSADNKQKTRAFCALAVALEQDHRQEQAERAWERAKGAASVSTMYSDKNGALKELAGALVRTQRWEQAEEIARSISDSKQQAAALKNLIEVLIKYYKHDRILHLVQRSYLQAETRDFALQEISLAAGLISLKPEIGIALYEAFKWVDTFLAG